MKKNISVISNLPSGGGSEVYRYQLDELKKHYTVSEYFSGGQHIKSSIVGFYIHVIKNILNNYKFSKIINEKSDLLLAYQAWDTKSPLIFPFIKKPIIYVCNEVPREYYDSKIIKTFSLKEKFINSWLLLPIKILDLLNIKLANNIRIISISKYAGKQINRIYNISPVIIYPGINLKEFGKYIELSKRKNQVITVGAINKYKNQKFIVRVLSKISTKIRPKLILVGNGYDEKYINEIVEISKKLNVNVKIYLNINRKQLISLYKESLIFMYSSKSEPYGLVVLEAMRSGLPLVVDKQGGGYKEIINNKCGYLLNNKLELWSVKCKKIIRSPKQWATLSEHNYRYSVNFSHKKSTNTFIKNINLALLQ